VTAQSDLSPQEAEAQAALRDIRRIFSTAEPVRPSFTAESDELDPPVSSSAELLPVQHGSPAPALHTGHVSDSVDTELVREDRAPTDEDYLSRIERLIASSPGARFRLCDHLPTTVQDELSKHSWLRNGFLSHVWEQPQNAVKVIRWAKAALTVTAAGKEHLSNDFLIASMSKTYNYDRALRGASAVERSPMHRDEVSDAFISPRYPSTHHLNLRTLLWDKHAPDTAVDAAARLIEAEPPDELMKAEAVPYIPVVGLRELQAVYAVYGEWWVEIARWK